MPVTSLELQSVFSLNLKSWVKNLVSGENIECQRSIELWNACCYLKGMSEKVKVRVDL